MRQRWHWLFRLPGQLLAGQAYGIVQFALEHLLRRQLGQILGHLDSGGLQSQQPDLLLRLPGAEDQANRRLFVRVGLVLFKPAGTVPSACRRANRPNFRSMAATTPPVVEQQIQVIIVVIYRCFWRATVKSVPVQQERQFVQDGLFRVAFQVSLRQRNRGSTDRGSSASGGPRPSATSSANRPFGLLADRRALMSHSDWSWRVRCSTTQTGTSPRELAFQGVVDGDPVPGSGSGQLSCGAETIFSSGNASANWSCGRDSGG